MKFAIFSESAKSAIIFKWDIFQKKVSAILLRIFRDSNEDAFAMTHASWEIIQMKVKICLICVSHFGLDCLLKNSVKKLGLRKIGCSNKKALWNRGAVRILGLLKKLAFYGNGLWVNMTVRNDRANKKCSSKKDVCRKKICVEKICHSQNQILSKKL